MKKTSATLLSAAMFAAVLLGACSGNDFPTSVNSGKLVVRLTNAASVADSLRSVDVFVVRVDGRLSATTDAEAAADVDVPGRSGWITLATPNASFNLLSLQNRVSDILGDATVRPGSYTGFRIIIDPSKSSVTLKSGRVLTGASSPGILFPSASRVGIRIVPSKPVVVVPRETTVLIVDFDVNASFVQRGTSIDRNGLLFRPVIRATTIDAGTISATVRFINLSRSPLSLRQDGKGVTRLELERITRCLVINPASPVAVNRVGSNASFVRFGPQLVPGFSYVVVAFDTPNGDIRFVTLANTFTPTSGQVGLRVLNVTGLPTGLDVFVTASGASASAATLANVLGDSVSAFVSVPAGPTRIRLTNAGGTDVLLDIQAEIFRAGQSATLVIRPPLFGLTVLRSFIVEGC